MPEDDGLLGLAMKRVELIEFTSRQWAFPALPQTAGVVRDRGRWIGWERKRGKLEELNISEWRENTEFLRVVAAGGSGT
jgi:hypothetical protein